MDSRGEALTVREFVEELARLFSEKARAYGLTPSGLYVVVPRAALPSVSPLAQYDALASILRDELAGLARRLCKPLVEIDLDALMQLYTDTDVVELVVRERFRVAWEQADKLGRPAIIYVPHLHLWLSSGELLALLRRLVKDAVREGLFLVVSTILDQGNVELSSLYEAVYEGLGVAPRLYELVLGEGAG